VPRVLFASLKLQLNNLAFNVLTTETDVVEGHHRIHHRNQFTSRAFFSDAISIIVKPKRVCGNINPRRLAWSPPIGQPMSGFGVYRVEEIDSGSERIDGLGNIYIYIVYGPSPSTKLRSCCLERDMQLVTNNHPNLARAQHGPHFQFRLHRVVSRCWIGKSQHARKKFDGYYYRLVRSVAKTKERI
jgi:hypothetical protein